jgi:hypothetical protein
MTVFCKLNRNERVRSVGMYSHANEMCVLLTLKPYVRYDTPLLGFTLLLSVSNRHYLPFLVPSFK